MKINIPSLPIIALILLPFCVFAQSNAPLITINGGDKYTNNSHVELVIKAEDAVEMNVSNTPSLPDNKWVKFDPKMPSWILDYGDGEKTVYAKIRFKDGSESEVITDDIILDTTPPQNPSIKIDLPTDFTNDKRLEVGILISAEDAKYVMISNHENFYGQHWRGFTEDYYDWQLEKGDDGLRFVYVKFRDIAGNETQAVHDVITYDTTAPYAAKVEIDGGKKYTIMQNRTVSLSIDGRGADSMMVAHDNAFTDAKWMPYSDAMEWVLTEDDGKKTVFVKFKDLATNESAVIKDDIILDTTPPANCDIRIDKGAPRTTDINKKVTLEFKAEEAAKMMVSNYSSFREAKWRFFVPVVKDWQLEGEQDGDRTVYVKYMDEAGNVSAPCKATIQLVRGF